MAALLALPARDARLERDSLADRVPFCVRAALDHDAGHLVPEDERLLDDVGADAAVFVVVDVGAADAHRAYLDEDLPLAWNRQGPLLDPYVARLVERCDGVPVLHGSFLAATRARAAPGARRSS